MTEISNNKVVSIDISGYGFEANNKLYPIEAGHVRTTHEDSGNIVWDWQAALELKMNDVIPQNKRTYILYPEDASIFLSTRVIKRHKEGNLSIFTLVPYIEGE